MGLLLLIAFLVWLPSEVKAPLIFAQRETENLVILEGNSLKGSFIPISSENDSFKGKNMKFNASNLWMMKIIIL